jgi:hypothetical protein
MLLQVCDDGLRLSEVHFAYESMTLAPPAGGTAVDEAADLPAAGGPASRDGCEQEFLPYSHMASYDVGGNLGSASQRDGNALVILMRCPA